MQPHEQRVVDEKNELLAKMTKLLEFFHTDTFKSLPAKEQKLLELQVDVMEVYYEVLNKRIALFN